MDVFSSVCFIPILDWFSPLLGSFRIGFKFVAQRLIMLFSNFFFSRPGSLRIGFGLFLVLFSLFHALQILFGIAQLIQCLFQICYNTVQLVRDWF